MEPPYSVPACIVQSGKSSDSNSLPTIVSLVFLEVIGNSYSRIDSLPLSSAAYSLSISIGSVRPSCFLISEGKKGDPV